MRYFTLLNFEHLMWVALPTVIFIIVFGIALGFMVFRTEDSEARKQRVIYRYPEDIEDRNAPFPLAMLLIFAGTIIWSFFYILVHGLMGVKI
ncbi:MAG: hypothetical protein AMJ54_05560 [Deltaproteobacteria bacterium SG8_13]|nr:MAG: hypothetical protein AMJ54_05560 [Deltaproteobacteria bacterium SG8_13]